MDNEKDTDQVSEKPGNGLTPNTKSVQPDIAQPDTPQLESSRSISRPSSIELPEPPQPEELRGLLGTPAAHLAHALNCLNEAVQLGDPHQLTQAVFLVRSAVRDIDKICCQIELQLFGLATLKSQLREPQVHDDPSRDGC